MLILTIWVGGMAGAWARYRLASWVYARTGTAFPWGTLAVNVTGSFVLGLLLPALDVAAPLTPAHAFITVGVIGAFTTFSTLAYEAVMLIQAGAWRRAAGYAGASIGLGLTAIGAGLLLGSMMVPR